MKEKERTNKHDYLDDGERVSVCQMLIMSLSEMGTFRKESWYLEDY